MVVLEVFLHPGCPSEQPARRLAQEIQQEYSNWQVRVIGSKDRARKLGISVLPAFVLNGRAIAVGVPRKEWLIGLLRELNPDG
ncbi:MAG: hypothetical protein AB1411_05855 [Nitrospirota bacterium]